MKEKNIILAARIMSMIFTPFYLPLVGLVALFLFSYMSLLPLAYKLPMLLTVYISTILMPSLLIHLYRRVQGWTSKELGRKERRIVPYLISILCYFGCFFLMEYRNTPRVISIILSSGIGDTDGMRTHQCMVEDLHPHGSHRRSGRRTGSLFDCLFLQSYPVAGIRHPAGRHGGYCPHDSPSAYVGAGGSRISRWSSVRSLYYISKVSIH